jgi:choline dehydrogenase
MSAPPRSALSRPIEAGYDVVVVGAGSGGCAVARRLVDAGAMRVLLIEAGEPGLDERAILDPAAWVPLARTSWDWGHAYAPSPHLDGRVIPIPRGRALGGSSATNAMLWYRGHPADYDAWSAMGCDGWSFAECLPFFRACEDWEGGADERRGAGGPLRIETSPDPHPIALALIEAAAEIGLPAIDDPNGASCEGAALANLNISGGRRVSSAKGYLEPILDHPNLTVLTGSQAIRLEIARGRAVGVTHLVDGAPVTTAADHIVLAAGAIETPRLLMLSGIGEAGALRRLGVPVRADLPGVGRNLQDHPMVRAVNVRARTALGPVRDNGGGSVVNWRSTAAQPRPDVNAIPIQNRSATTELAAAHDLSGELFLSGEVFAIAPGLMRSRSVGHLRLLEAKPGGAIEIQPNFLAEPADRDALVAAVRTVLDLLATRAFAGLAGEIIAPAPRAGRADIEAFVRIACSTYFHPVGTCAMGAGAESVVDPRLMVRGVEGLMIADASVMPVIPACNTHAPTVMIGERAAAFLLAGHGSCLDEGELPDQRAGAPT